MRSWRNWQTRKTKDLVSHRHAGSTPVDRTIHKKAFLQGGCFCCFKGDLMKTNYLIIGAGPAGIFTALELIRNGHKGNEITIVEKGAAIEKRSCPKTHTGNCVGCKNCSITTGFSGAGAFSDGKLSLSPDVGGDLPELIGYDFAKELIDYADSIYLEFGADTRIEGIEFPEEIKKIRKRAIKAGLKLVDCPIRHLGTEKAQEI